MLRATNANPLHMAQSWPRQQEQWPRYLPDANITIHDWNGVDLPAGSELLAKCRSALEKRLGRRSQMPVLNMDPLSPLPIADAAPGGPSVGIIYFILASRSYAAETINRNVRALQRPGELGMAGSNSSNLFLLHVDDKMSDQEKARLRSSVKMRPDLYYMRRPRAVMWSGFSMMLPLLDAMASVLARKLSFEYLINFSDADLTLRTDTEIRAFLARFPGRSVMSIVQRTRDPRRYKQHEGFRRHCWFECDHGSGWVVSNPNGEKLDGQRVIGKKKCCWSRSAPIVYTRSKLGCHNQKLPAVFHGSQWVMLHRSMVEHVIRHPVAQDITAGFEQTLLPDEAMLQTIAVNSPLRPHIIASHLRYIEWPQLHGDANKYWASLGPKFHGGPMVINATMAEHKAFLTSAAFVRKVDPTIYTDVLDVWDRWMDTKLVTQAPGPRQPLMGSSLTHSDPELRANIPAATSHENDARVDGEYAALPVIDEARAGASPAHGSHSSALPPDEASSRLNHAAHGDDHHDGEDEHDHDHEHGMDRNFTAGSVAILLWVVTILGAALVMVCRALASDGLGSLSAWIASTARGPKVQDLKAT